MGRTVIDATPQVDPWPIIEAWARDHRFTLQAHGPWGRTYKRGDGFWVAAVYVQIEAMPTGLRLSAWTPFWMTGQECDVHSNDPIAYFPRRAGRKRLNDLLGRLGLRRIGS